MQRRRASASCLRLVLQRREQLTSLDIKQKARELGFDLCGIAPAGDLPELAFFQTWLARGYAGEMAYLDRSAEQRADVRRVLPSARSVIVTGTVYNTDRPVFDRERRSRSRAHRALRLGRRLSRRDRRPARRAARVDARTASAAVRRARLRRHRSGAGARVRAARRHRLDWQEHLRDQPRASARGSFSRRSSAACRSRPDAPAFDQCGTCTLCLDACPDARARGARRARLDAVHFVSDDRAARPHSRRARGGGRVARLRLRRVPGSLSVEPDGAELQRSRLAAARRRGRTRTCPALSAMSDEALRRRAARKRDEANEGQRSAAQSRVSPKAGPTRSDRASGRRVAQDAGGSFWTGE